MDAARCNCFHSANLELIASLSNLVAVTFWCFAYILEPLTVEADRMWQRGMRADVYKSEIGKLIFVRYHHRPPQVSMHRESLWIIGVIWAGIYMNAV